MEKNKFKFRSKIRHNRNKSGVKEQFISIPIWLIKQTSNKKYITYLTPFERELFCLIHGLNSSGFCYANDQYFAKIFSVTIKHVNSSIQRLCKRRMLFIWYENHKRLIKSAELGNIKGSLLAGFEGDKIIFSDGKKQIECDRKEFFSEKECDNDEDFFIKHFGLKPPEDNV